MLTKEQCLFNVVNHHVTASFPLTKALVVFTGHSSHDQHLAIPIKPQLLLLNWPLSTDCL